MINEHGYWEVETGTTRLIESNESRVTQRRFPPPWRIERLPGGFKVVDAHGQSLAYFYARDNDNDAGTAGVLTMDEARRLASNFAKLPDLLGAVRTNWEGSG